MKKIYLILFTIAFNLIGYGQSTIVTVDRDNIIGPTATGNDPAISSVGLVRGTGINITTGPNNFTSRNWDAANLAEAITNQEYIEWSVSANVINDIELNGLDIRLRRNANGPANWQIFYSLNGFTTNADLTGAQTTPTSAGDFLFTNLGGTPNMPVVSSGTGGTITFRLYAWGASTSGGWLRVANKNAWSDYGITRPGTRLIGNIISTATNSTESNIIASTGFTPTSNIDYSAYAAPSGLTTSNAIKIGEFVIQDGGDDLTDTDLLPTILTDIGFDVIGNANLAALAIFDGSTNVSEIVSVGSTINFNGLNLIAPDNSSKTFDVYATFNTVVTDNEQFELIINSATPNAIAGSAFSTFNAGGASTPVGLDENRIEVTATSLVFDQQPSDVNQLEIMTPYPSVNAVDGNGNLDADYFGTVNVISSGSMSPPSINYNISNGVGIFDTIIFSQQGTNISLVVIPIGLSPAVSGLFNVLGPIITVAIQDFDSSSPEWTYTNDIPFFNNGWGTDGFYGIIDASSAAPLDYPYFSNNILGENDLNDEGNGTNGWATILFDPVNISNFTDVEVRFDWQVIGYANNNDNAQYQLFFDGVGQGRVFLFDGDNANPVQDGAGSIKLMIPDAVNEVALEIRVRNNGINGYSGFDNFKVVSVFDGLIYANNAWTPNPPSNLTGTDNAYVINGTYNVGTNIQINNLYVNNGATTEVTAGQSITANTDIVNYGVVELNSVSTTYSSLIAENVDGSVVYNRHVNQLAPTGSTTGNNDLISAPVTNANQTFLAFRTANPDLPSGTIGGVPSFLFGPFDNNADAYINYTVSNDASLLDAGIGYRTASTAPAGSTFRFEGDVETGTILTPITVGSSSNFNLIGNPYPSYISLSSFLADNNSEFNATTSGVYGYDGAAVDGFTIWNQAYSDANPTAVIAPGQGFLVSSKAGGGEITFAPTMRSTGTTDDFIPGRTIPIEHLQLELSASSDIYKTDFYFTDNATLGLDPGYDSGVFGGSAPDFSIYSHLIENNNGLDIAVQSIGYSEFNDVIIPIGVNAPQNEEISISILESSLPDSVNVYLEDTENNTVTLLNDGDYILTPSNTITGTGRYFLRFSESSLSINESAFNNLNVFATVTPKSLFIKGNLSHVTSVHIYDLQGRLVLSSSLESGSSSNEIDLSNLGTGIYAVTLSNKSLTKTQKIIIK